MLLQTGRSGSGIGVSTRTEARAKRRANQALSSLAPWLSPGKKLYVSTDETDPNYLKSYRAAGIDAVQWTELLEEGKKGKGPLATVLQSLEPGRLERITGQVEQVICAFGQVF